jgi:tetratricopeptide (TPR) repeat protein
MPEFTYDAFISYRRSDGATVARWLRRQIESFRIPKTLKAQFTTPLRVYLDSAYERGTSDFYEMNIRPALLSSRNLIVVATPNAQLRTKGEDWIHREIADFCAGPNGKNVFVARGKGTFNDPLPSDLSDRFPNIEIIDLRGASRFSFLNPLQGARLLNEKLNLIAPIVGLPPEAMPAVRREQEKRQQTRLGIGSGVALGTLIAVSALTAYALLSRYKAMQALESSMFSTGRIIQAVSNGGNDRSAVLMEACDLLDKLRAEADRQPEIAGFVTCRLDRARAYEEFEELAQARGEIQEAIKLASDQFKHVARTEAAIQITAAQEALAQFLLRHQNNDEALEEYEKLAADANDFALKFPEVPAFARASGEAMGQMGDIHLGHADRTKAGIAYDGAAEAVERAIKLYGDNTEDLVVEWLARLYRLAGEQHEAVGDFDEAIARFERAALAGNNLGKEIAPLELEHALSLAHISIIEYGRGQKTRALSARDQADYALSRTLKGEQLNAVGQKRAAAIKSWLEATSSWITSVDDPVTQK